MNRRDIIIVAVLINAGLLVTLFVSSLKKEKGVELVFSEPVKKEVSAALAPSSPNKTGKDQVDQVISQYEALAKGEEKKEEAPSAPMLTPKKKVEEAPLVKASTPAKMPLRVVTVEKGDVLEKIARSHGVSVDEIIKLNNLPNSRLQIGQELKLPEKKAAKAPLKKEEEGNYYVVKGGDSPWTIAQKNHMQVEELLRINQMDEEKAKKLRPGDRLKIK